MPRKWLVPSVEITEAILAAGCAELDFGVAQDIVDGFASPSDVVSAMFRAMIKAAAPEQQM
jgi:hypothetical protein